MSRILILLGGPGAGKGTQAKRLAASLCVPHVSTGDLFRANLAKETELGQKAKGFMSAGKLVPDDLVLDMLFDRVAQDDCKGGYLLDGFPRTLPQAEAFEHRLEAGTGRLVINIDVDDETLVARLTERRTCRACGNVHHLRFAPPKSEGLCDACGGELYQREDDGDAAVRERLRVYHDETHPLVDFYAGRDVLRTVDGTLAPDDVFDALNGILRKDS